MVSVAKGNPQQKHSKHSSIQLDESDSEQTKDAYGPGTEIFSQGSLIEFTPTMVVEATKNYSHKLGAGGFLEVYRGFLQCAFIAVKKLTPVS